MSFDQEALCSKQRLRSAYLELIYNMLLLGHSVFYYEADHCKVTMWSNLNVWNWDAGISFNILLFGSSYRLMWPNYQPYNKNAEQAALTWLDHNCHANLGGTELLSAMQSIYSRPPSQGNLYSLPILKLTRGIPQANHLYNLLKEVMCLTWEANQEPRHQTFVL